jgi:26S proteasome regulatory subunit N2
VILLIDTQPSEPKTLLELKVRKTAPAPGAPGQSLADRVTDAYAERDAQAAGAATGGAAEAAGVLNAVDEDEEGSEEADLPGDFDYMTDGEGEE